MATLDELIDEYGDELVDEVIEKNLSRIAGAIEVDELRQMVDEAWGYDDSLSDYRWEYNDEEFFNIFYENNAMEALRAAHYGEYNYNDEYVRINDYGNLETTDGSSYNSDLQSGAEEITQRYIEMMQEGNVDERSVITDEIESVLEELAEQ